MAAVRRNCQCGLGCCARGRRSGVGESGGGSRVVLADDTRVASPDYDRTPPQDVPAEQSVLGGMLLSKDAIADVIEALRPTDFYRPAHQLIYDAVLDLYARGEPADAVTVSAELTRAGQLARIGGAAYLHTLIATVPTAANAGYYAQIVAEKAILRRLVTAGTRIVQMGYQTAAGSGDLIGSVDDVVDRAQAEVYDVTERRTSDDYVHIESLLTGTLTEIERIADSGGVGTGIPTGFTRLDEITNGLHPGQMITVAGRPGSGKALALDTPLPTPTGWTTIGAVQVGDALVGADGRSTRVVAATDVMHGRPCYEVEFSDGAVIVADGQHQWLTWTRAARRYDTQLRGLGKTYAEPVLPEVVTTEQIAATLYCPTADRRPNHAVPIQSPMEMPEADLPIPAYVLGTWLGDGHAASARFTTFDPEIIVNMEASGLAVVPQQHSGVYGIVFLSEQSVIPNWICVVCGRSFRPKNQQVRTCGRVCGGKARFCSDPSPAPSCRRCGGPLTGQLPSSGLCMRCWKTHGTVQAE